MHKIYVYKKYLTLINDWHLQIIIVKTSPNMKKMKQMPHEAMWPCVVWLQKIRMRNFNGAKIEVSNTIRFFQDLPEQQPVQCEEGLTVILRYKLIRISILICLWGGKKEEICKIILKCCDSTSALTHPPHIQEMSYLLLWKPNCKSRITIQNLTCLEKSDDTLNKLEWLYWGIYEVNVTYFFTLMQHKGADLM